MKGKPYIKWIIIGVLSFFLLIILIQLIKGFYVIVPAGNVGVYELFGKVRDEELQPGFHFKNPLARVIPMSTRTQYYTMSIASNEGQRLGDDSITALTKEGLTISLDITVLYHLIPQKASDVYKDIGIDYPEILIRPSIRSIIREETAKYEAKDIYSEKRAELRDAIFEALQEKINNRGIELEDVLLRNVNLPEELSKAIEAKLTAEQEAEKYDFILQSTQKEAERKKIEAEGQKAAQQIINETLSTKYLQYLYIQNISQCSGTIYVPVNPQTGLPLFLDVKSSESLSK